MDKFVELLGKNWVVVSNAPIAFVALAVAMFSLAYFAAKWKYTATIGHMQSAADILKERLIAKTEQAESLKERALKYDEKAELIVEASGTELREKTLALVAQMRSFLESANAKERRASDAYMLEMRQAATEDQRRLIWNSSHSYSSQQSSQTNAEYDRRFKIDAMLLRDELLSRLPNYKTDSHGPHLYEHPTNPLGIAAVTDDLEKMAKSLKA